MISNESGNFVVGRSIYVICSYTYVTVPCKRGIISATNIMILDVFNLFLDVEINSKSVDNRNWWLEFNYQNVRNCNVYMSQFHVFAETQTPNKGSSAIENK